MVRAFDGSGGWYESVLVSLEKKAVWIEPLRHFEGHGESSLDLELAQGISRGQRMDYTIQKAVELGVKRIVPLITGFSAVRLADGRAGRRLEHWQKIIIHACEQSGRDTVPEISEPVRLHDWLESGVDRIGLVLDPRARTRLRDAGTAMAAITLVCGPEGGLSEDELALCRQAGLQPVSLGPRILRTETAATAALAMCQGLWGDM